MPEGLREFRIELIPNAPPARQGIEAWCIVFMLRYIFIADHAAWRWTDKTVKHHSPSNRQLVRFSLEFTSRARKFCWNTALALPTVVRTAWADWGHQDRTTLEAPHLSIWEQSRFSRESSILFFSILQILASPLPTLSLERRGWIGWTRLLDTTSAAPTQTAAYILPRAQRPRRAESSF
jgi:hypothetical protein